MTFVLVETRMDKMFLNVVILFVYATTAVETTNSAFRSANHNFNTYTNSSLSNNSFKGNDSKELCRDFGSCSYNEATDVPSCYCDDVCVIFHDCCYDAPQIGSNKTLELTKEDERKLEFSTCKTNIFKSPEDDIFGVYLIAKCSSSFPNVNITRSCSSPDNFYPVTSVDGTTYANIYCAACHNVHDYSSWTFEYLYMGKCIYSLMESMNQTNLIQKLRYVIKSGCQYAFYPQTLKDVRFCAVFPVPKYLSTSKTKLCMQYQNPLMTLSKNNVAVIYRNAHCMENINNEALPKCVTFTIPSRQQKGFTDITMTGIFNIRPAFFDEQYSKCKTDEFYNDALGVCTRKECVPEMQNDTCNIEVIKNYFFESGIIFNFTSDGLEDKDFITRTFAVVLTAFPLDFYQMKINVMYSRFKCGYLFESPYHTCCVATGVVKLIIGKKMSKEELRILISNMEKINWKYTEDKNGNLTTATHRNDENKSRAECNISEQENTRINRLTIYHGLVQKTMKTIVLPDHTDLREDVPECFEAYGIQEEKLDKFNQTQIRLTNLNITYRKYNITDTEGFLTVQRNNLHLSIENIMTYVTTGTSCIALLVTMSVYKYLDLTVSSAGVLSFNMMGTMLFAQLLFLFGGGAEKMKTACYIIGVISHYAWLTSFSWISVFLIEVLKMIRKFHTIPGFLNEKQNLNVYAFMIGYGAPSVIVLSSVLLDLYAYLDVGYTGKMCFPSGYPANMFVVTIPIATSLLVNAVALVASIVYLSKFNNSILLAGTFRNFKSLIPTYIKLSILCAFPWVLGIISDIFNFEVLRYIYIVSAGSQGLFVSICFLMGKYVKSGFKRKWEARTIHRSTLIQAKVSSY